MVQHTELLRLLASVLGADLEGTLPQRLSERAVHLLQMDGLVVTLLSTSDHRHVVCASGDDAVAADDVQFTLGDGPVVEAFRDRVPVLVPDLPHETLARWPLLGESAARWPRYSGVFAFPLLLGDDEAIGVMGLYRREPGRLDEQTVTQARLVADAMVVAVPSPTDASVGLGGLEGLDRDPGLTRWSGAEQVVHQAVGMVVLHLQVEPCEALARLRAHAFAADSDLDQVALDVVERRLLLHR